MRSRFQEAARARYRLAEPSSLQQSSLTWIVSRNRGSVTLHFQSFGSDDLFLRENRSFFEEMQHEPVQMVPLDPASLLDSQHPSSRIADAVYRRP